MMKSSEIKQVTLTELKGKWGKALSITTLFTIVNIALSYVLTALQNVTIHTPILYYGVSLIYLAIFLPLSFGLISSIRKLLRGDRIQNTTFLNDAILNYSKTISIFIRTLLKMLLPSVIIIIGITGILFLTVQLLPITDGNMSGYALYIILLSMIVSIGIALSALPYVLSSYILIDNKEMKAKDIIMQSATLMENKKWDFVKLLFSFIGWILLIAILATIAGMYTYEIIATYVQWFGMIFFMPYLLGSISIFYEEASDSKEVVVENSEN